MSLTSFIVFLHVAAAFGLVTGLLGWDILLGQARRSDDIRKVEDLVSGAGPFERYLVVPGSFVVLILGIVAWRAEELPFWGEGTRWVTVSLFLVLTLIPLIPLVFIPRGTVFEAALNGAIEADQVTPELTAAFNDPVVAAARWYELGVVAVVILLMVAKPF